ncbi:MAG: hypothetical protein WA173_17650 [Pseudomonas sp.]|uniref:hypothetical protein n=1 Tax=Pseudomonas sp. TaxID=306 RepID=UPI003BB7EACA
MNTLIVEKVEPYSPGDESASVLLRSERGLIEVFCYPCDLKVGDFVENRLSVLDADVRAAYLVDWPDEEKVERSIERLEKVGPYAYKGCARTLDQQKGLIEVLGFCIDVGEVLFDGPVEFEFSRVDI